MRHLGSCVLCLALLASVPAAAHEVYISSEKDNTVSVIDTKSLQVVRTFKVGKRPRGITFSRDFSKFYVCASDDNAVQVYDARAARRCCTTCPPAPTPSSSPSPTTASASTSPTRTTP